MSAFCHPFVRIEACDRAGNFSRARAEVLFADNAAVADDEGHDARHAVLERPGDRRESADHASIDDVVAVTARRRRPLSVEQAEVVAVLPSRGATIELRARSKSTVQLSRKPSAPSR